MGLEMMGLDKVVLFEVGVKEGTSLADKLVEGKVSNCEWFLVCWANILHKYNNIPLRWKYS